MSCFQSSLSKISVQRNVFVPFEKKEVVETKYTHYRYHRKGGPWIEDGIEMHPNSIHDEKIENGIEHDNQICYPQVRHGEQSHTAAI